MKSFFLDYLLKTLAQALAGNSRTIVEYVLRLVETAERNNWKGGEKFAWVKETFLIYKPEWKGMPGWILDTIIHLLVAWLNRQQAKHSV